MSDESDDKTEDPTPHRLEKAREEGQIPRSRELTSLLILLVGISVIWFGGASLARRLSGMLSVGLNFDHRIINDPNMILGQIILLIREAMLALLPLISGVVLVASFRRSCWEVWYSAVNHCSRSFPDLTHCRVLNASSRPKLGLNC